MIEKGTNQNEYTQKEQAELIQVAYNSIEYGLEYHKEGSIPANHASPALLRKRATFVTLLHRGELRGCIGSLEARLPLIADVFHNAYQSAFRDSRFAPLSSPEYPAIRMEISILSPLVDIQIQNEEDLLNQLTPGETGLVIRDGIYQATFLPSVWEQLPKKEDFLRQLKRKAGMATDHWSSSMEAAIYTVKKIRD